MLKRKEKRTQGIDRNSAYVKGKRTVSKRERKRGGLNSKRIKNKKQRGGVKKRRGDRKQKTPKKRRSILGEIQVIWQIISHGLWTCRRRHKEKTNQSAKNMHKRNPLKEGQKGSATEPHCSQKKKGLGDRERST